MTNRGCPKGSLCLFNYTAITINPTFRCASCGAEISCPFGVSAYHTNFLQ
ncbi:hypothetical protein Barb6_00418 [Bacteroidales bacterium Barb6]|nr:hypothetical protein Barb6_00418 [Bacteroidales bacterium Barb6]